MSLYGTQKLIYMLNRDPHVRERFEGDQARLLSEYPLTEEERQALVAPDIGLLYVLGVNGQLLMHFAALRQIPWDDYLQAMRDGLAKHGPVREGVYAEAGYEGIEAHEARLRSRRTNADSN